MILQGERLIPAPIEHTWAALNDPETLQACIQGCELLERVGDHEFQSVVAVRIGPVSAKFKGKLEMVDILAPNSCTLHFEGQGGVAGFGKGSAVVQLTDEGSNTRLAYKAEAKVGGKIAQLGSRLVDAAAGKLSDDFFRAFEQHFAASADARFEALSAAAATPNSGLAKWWWVAAIVLGIGVLWLWMINR